MKRLTLIITRVLILKILFAPINAGTKGARRPKNYKWNLVRQTKQYYIWGSKTGETPRHTDCIVCTYCVYIAFRTIKNPELFRQSSLPQRVQKFFQGRKGFRQNIHQSEIYTSQCWTGVTLRLHPAASRCHCFKTVRNIVRSTITITAIP